MENSILVELIRLLGPVEIEGDVFGKVYEYFLGNFAMKEGQRGRIRRHSACNRNCLWGDEC